METTLIWLISVVSNTCDSFFEEPFIASVEEAESYFLERFKEANLISRGWNNSLNANVSDGDNWWSYTLNCLSE